MLTKTSATQSNRQEVKNYELRVESSQYQTINNGRQRKCSFSVLTFQLLFYSQSIVSVPVFYQFSSTLHVGLKGSCYQYKIQKTLCNQSVGLLFMTLVMDINLCYSDIYSNSILIIIPNIFCF